VQLLVSLAASCTDTLHSMPLPLQNAPYKRRGKIPFGVQRGTYGLTAEEKMRRRWREWSAAGSNGSGAPALAAAAAEPNYQVRGGAAEGLAAGVWVLRSRCSSAGNSSNSSSRAVRCMAGWSWWTLQAEQVKAVTAAWPLLAQWSLLAWCRGYSMDDQSSTHQRHVQHLN
jgi:hypothetical protein